MMTYVAKYALPQFCHETTKIDVLFYTFRVQENYFIPSLFCSILDFNILYHFPFTPFIRLYIPIVSLVILFFVDITV